MDGALSYHNGLLEQGYSEEEALEHTQRYFPDFSLDGRKPDPAPPPGFEAIPSEPKPVDEKIVVETPIVDFDRIKFKTAQYFDTTVDSIKENKKLVIGISGAIAALLLIYIVLQIPASTHPIEGAWTKADGQVFNFDIDGSFSDGTGNDATWEVDDDEVTIITEINGNSGKIVVKQILKYGFSDDEQAIWMSWLNQEVDGEEIDSEVTCILLVKDSKSYSSDAGKYESETPSWCLEKEM